MLTPLVLNIIVIKQKVLLGATLTLAEILLHPITSRAIRGLVMDLKGDDDLGRNYQERYLVREKSRKTFSSTRADTCVHMV